MRAKYFTVIFILSPQIFKDIFQGLRKICLLTIVFFLSSFSTLYAIDYTLLNTGDWNVTTNWSPNGVPGVGDKAIIPSGKAVTLVGDVTIDYVDLTGGTISGNFNLTISGTLVWNSGGFSGSGIVHVTGIINASGSSDLTIGGTKELRISNLATFTSTSMRIMMSGTAKILVLSAGSFIWNGTGSFFGTSSNIFEVQNGATLTKIGTGELNMNSQVNLLNCTTNVNGGTLKISAPGTTQAITNGTIQINTNSKLSLSRGSGNPVYNIAGATISGYGILEVSGTTTANFESGTVFSLTGTIAPAAGVTNIKSGCIVNMMPKILITLGTLNDDIGITAGEVSIGGGTYGGLGSPTFGNGFTWTSGGFSGSGIVHVTGIINASGSSDLTIGGTKELLISNLATFTSTSMRIMMSGTAKILVLSAGSFIWNGTGSFFGTSSNIFEVQNGATLTKIGTGELNINSQVNLLNCTTNINGGTLKISAPGTTQAITNGTIQINTNSKLSLSRSSGNPVYNIAGATISGDGILEVSGTTTANFESGTVFSLTGTIAPAAGVTNIKSGCIVNMMPKILITLGTLNDDIGITAGEVSIGGGTYGGTGSPTFGNGFTWTAGGFSGSGIVHVTGILTASSNNVHTIGGSKELRISNVATFTSTPMTMTGTAKILVLSGGTFIWNGSTLINISGSSSNIFEIQNGGIFYKAGIGILTFNTVSFFNYGVLKGNGIINFSAFTNAGMVSPGLTTGVLTLNKFSNTNSTLSIDINGPGVAGTARDSLKITGTPTNLGGILEIVLGSGYIPDSASQFCVASLPAGYGTFGTLNSLGLPSDTMGWKIIYNPTSIYVKYCPVWYADTDGDGYGDFNNNSKFCDCVNNLPGYSRKFTDCNDNNGLVNPGVIEICNGVDDDCDGDVDEGVQNTYYADSDNDSYGDASVTILACSAPNGYVSDNTDCNDNNGLVHPGATEICNVVDDDCDGSVDEGVQNTYYADNDNDGYGNASVTTMACLPPNGYVSNNTDCNDNNILVNPGATEICNGLDDDCDGMVDESVQNTYYADTDNDSYGDATVTTLACSPPNGYVSNNTDCNDNNGLVNPGTTEICNGLDDDCDGMVDEGVQNTYYADTDNDSYGDASVTTLACSAPNGYVTDNTDCNDNNGLVYPGATEICNGMDDDCDGEVDEDVLNTFYADNDLDGYGNALSGTTQGCTLPSGYSINNDDCNDEIASINPSAIEVCNLLDDDCDGVIDDGLPTYTYYLDADGDGYGNPDIWITTCFGTPVPGHVTAYGNGPYGGGSDDDGGGGPGGGVGGGNVYFDSDDGNPQVNPGIPEICNGIDDDSDGLVDESVLNTYYFDGDLDTYGHPDGPTVQACTAPEGYATNNADCDDTNANVNPAHPEVCNGLDDNCDGQVDNTLVFVVYYTDVDGDGNGDPTLYVSTCDGPPVGYVLNDDDCDDENVNTYPGAVEFCDGIDNNCNGMIDEGVQNTYYVDTDNDGYGDASVTTIACSAPSGYVSDNTDCNDNNGLINPGATEICNSVDDDCDGMVDEGVQNMYYVDTDNDGYGDASVTTMACSPPTGYVTDNTDCNDNNGLVHPGATEICNGMDDDCDGMVDEGVQNTYYVDTDNDGYGDASVTTIACSAPSGYVSNNIDCNDNNGLVHPGATEICNGMDDDCDGDVDEGVQNMFYADADNDGYGNVSLTSMACSAPVGYVSNSTDCDDSNASVNPGATEVSNGLDDDCDSIIDNSDCMVPNCNITSTRSGIIIGNASTNAAVNQMFIGYGHQSMTLGCIATGGGPFSYSWSGSNLNNVNISNPIFTPSAGGSFTFTCTVTNSFGCQTTCSVVICVIDVRVSGGNANNLKVKLCHKPPGNPNNGQSLQISINAVQAHISNHSGDRLGSCSDGCYISKPVQTKTEKDELEYVDFSIFPNPAISELNIHLQGYESGSDLMLFDQFGKKIWKMQLDNNVHIINLDLMDQRFTNGLYFIQAIQAGNIVTKRFVLVK